VSAGRDALLLFNLAMDADDPALGFATMWVNRLAAHFERIDVITMRAGTVEAAPNVRVYSVGKERGFSERHRALEFYRLLRARLAVTAYTACFAHMMPLFAVMGAPLLKVRGIPITLWYTHRQTSRTLRLALAVSRRVVTAAPDSFPIPTPKKRVLGHGIDTTLFAPKTAEDTADPASADGTAVQVARIAPIKHQATLIRAIADIQNLRAVFVGAALDKAGAAYRRQLEQLARTLGVYDRVTFAGRQDVLGVRDAMRGATVAVNLSPPGLFDKAALESMATGTPTIVSSAGFDDLLGEYAAALRIPDPEDDRALADALRQVLGLSLPERKAMGRTLRERVMAVHSLDRLIPRLVSVLRTGEMDGAL
jgi:glycosyltransferase involved in cell wall biosynthesis